MALLGVLVASLARAEPGAEEAISAEQQALLRAASRACEESLGAKERDEGACAAALRLTEGALGPDHLDVATRLEHLAEVLSHSEAEPLLRRALAIRETALGPDHPEVAETSNKLGLLLKAAGAYAEAEPFYRRALAIWEAALGPDHPDVATSLNNLAVLLKDTGAYAEAEPLYRRALAIWEVALGPDHPDVATALNNLGLFLKTTGAHAEAEPLYRRALAIREAVLGPDHPAVATSLGNLARLLQTTGALTEAEPLYRRALAIGEASLGKEHPEVARSLSNLACEVPSRTTTPSASRSVASFSVMSPGVSPILLPDRVPASASGGALRECLGRTPVLGRPHWAAPGSGARPRVAGLATPAGLASLHAPVRTLGLRGLVPRVLPLVAAPARWSPRDSDVLPVDVVA